MKKSRRNEIYKAALAEVQKEGWGQIGLCYILSRHIDKENEPDPYENINKFPEIYKHRPKKREYGEYWFPLAQKGHHKRENILKQAIKETNPKTNGIRRTSKRASVSSSGKKSKGKRVVARVATRKSPKTR